LSERGHRCQHGHERLSDLGVLYPTDHAGVVADLVLPR
jgi:hypothetical protein